MRTASNNIPIMSRKFFPNFVNKIQAEKIRSISAEDPIVMQFGGLLDLCFGAGVVKMINSPTLHRPNNPFCDSAPLI